MASHLPRLSPIILFLLAFFFLYSAAVAHNYKDALTKTILFFEGQRSGKLPPNQRMSWRGDSALSDGSNAHVDLKGGYYDGGDNVKSTFPMAFTTTILSWSVLKFGGLMKGELQSAKMAIRWASDYLIKATAHPNTIYVQAFEFADEHRGSYSKCLLDALVCPLLCTSSGYEDELLWGAAWLYKATGDPIYLNFTQTNANVLGSDEKDYTFGRDNKNAGARILPFQVFLVQRVQGLEDMKKQADNYICFLIPGSSSPSPSHYTPGGLLFKMRDKNMQYVTSASFLLLTYADHLQSVYAAVKCGGVAYFPRTLRAIAKKQVDYLLGSNPLKMSFMVGHGPKFPRRIHHRGSSIPPIRAHPENVQCSAGISYYLSQNPNPNTLVGAVVGGPGQFDRFPDLRGDSDRSEPATCTNAPLVGLLAYLAHSSGQL